MASRALAAYAELSTKRPYAVAFGSCAVKGVIADTISQRIVEGKQEQNWKRTAVFAFYGGWYCGWFQHALYNVGYARLFGLDTSLKNAVRKVAFDSAVHVPLVCFPVYYAYKGYLYDGIGMRGGLERYTHEWQMICSNYYMVWVPANLLVFTVVPVPLRIGFIACTSLGWLTAVLLKLRAQRLLSAYIRLLVRREACNLGGAPIPRLQICQRPLDGIVWVQGRAVLGSFGFRYERRAEYYLVLVTVVLGGAMVDFFIQLVTDHQRKLLTQSRTWALLFFLLLLFLVLAYFAALANEKCETAVSLFAQRRLAAQANAAQFPALAARAQASDEILACAAEQLEIYNRVHDARLFGIRADGGVIFSLVSLAVTFYVFVFFWMFGIDAGR
ncbi:unnamed protein product [Pelagomonas calceolata]|uniref:Uncharacterized protein n=1 Tax=Pelagomonas calceolata TaxID=35677 RepID=A0A8J2T1R3_9STRA|nr:unnamed protein product [Pelagomonas calceolata]